MRAGTDHVVALLRGGKLLSWGTGEQGQLGRVGARLPERGLKELLLAPAEISLKRTAKAAAADPIVDIAAGNYSTFGLTQQGQVWAWGLNNYGQLGQEGEVRRLPRPVNRCVEVHADTLWLRCDYACHPFRVYL